MAAITLNPFGGLQPSQNPRRLANEQAVTADNVQVRFGDLRPLATDAVVRDTAGITNPRTIFRSQRTTGNALNTVPAVGWHVKAEDVDYADGPITDAIAASRVYFTGALDVGGATAVPKVLDVTGAEKFLGVPPPPALSMSVEVGDEFTPDERTGSIDSLVDSLATYVRAFLDPQYAWIGPSDSVVAGLVRRNAAGGFDPEVPAHLLKGISGDGSKLTDPERHGWTLDPRIDGFWHGSFFCVPIAAFGYWCNFTPAALGLLKAQMRLYWRPDQPALVPGTNELFTEAQITDFAAVFNEMFSLSGSFMVSKRQELDALVTTFDETMVNGLDIARKEAVKAYYGTASTAEKVSAAKNAFAAAAYDLGARIATAAQPMPDGEGGS